MASSIQAQILEEVRGLSTGQAKIEVMVDNLNKAVIGNGKPGLLDRVSKIENKHTSEEKEKEKKNETKAKWDIRAWAIVMLFISQIVIVIFK